MKQMVRCLLFMALGMVIFACEKKDENAKQPETTETMVPQATQPEATPQPTTSPVADAQSAPTPGAITAKAPVVDMITDSKVLAMIKLGDINKLIDDVCSWTVMFEPMMNAEIIKGMLQGQTQYDVKTYPKGKNIGIFLMAPQTPTIDVKQLDASLLALIPLAETSQPIQMVKQMLPMFGDSPRRPEINALGDAEVLVTKFGTFDARKQDADVVKPFLNASMDPSIWASFNIDAFLAKAGMGLLQQARDSALMEFQGMVEQLTQTTHTAQTEMMAQQLEATKQLVNVGFDAIEKLLKQIQSAGFGVMFNADSVDMLKVVQFKADSTAIAALGKSHPTQDLTQFVDDSAAVRVSGAMDSTIFEGFMGELTKFLEASPEARVKAMVPLFNELSTGMSKFGVVQQAVAYSFANDKLVIESVMTCDNVQEYNAMTMKWMESFTSTSGGVFSDNMTTMTFKALPDRTVRNLQVHSWETTMQMPPMDNNVPAGMRAFVNGFSKMHIEVVNAGSYIVSTVNTPVEAVLDRVFDNKLTRPMASSKDGLGILNLDVNVSSIVNAVAKDTAIKDAFKSVSPVTLSIYSKDTVLWQRLSVPRDLVSAIASVAKTFSHDGSEVDIDVFEFDEPTSPSDEDSTDSDATSVTVDESAA